MQLAALPLPDSAEPPFVPAIPSAFVQFSDAEFAVRRRSASATSSCTTRTSRSTRPSPASSTKPRTTRRCSPSSRRCTAPRPTRPSSTSLIDAAGRGKQVAVLVELTARFDEANNIEWARRLEEAGVHVAYGNPNLKIHSKICLVVREEATGVTMYAHIGTGNYNSRTARLYTDLGLFTADPAIGRRPRARVQLTSPGPRTLETRSCSSRR